VKNGYGFATFDLNFNGGLRGFEGERKKLSMVKLMVNLSLNDFT
jgi:hypothetical protein